MWGISSHSQPTTTNVEKDKGVIREVAGSVYVSHTLFSHDNLIGELVFTNLIRKGIRTVPVDSYIAQGKGSRGQR